MNKSMKTIIAILFLCMSMAVLVSCGSDADKTITSDSGSTQPALQISENPGDVYRVVTVDEAGEPVQDVMIQFCSDELCMMGQTDEEGIAVFEGEEKDAYTAHVYAVPDGYAEDETEYEVPDKYGDVVITIQESE